jgi:hypothetical protein
VKHIADAESEFKVVNITPDFCRVDGCVVPFDIKQDLSEERTEYAKDFFARGKRVLRLGSVVRGVEGNAGEGVISGVSQDDGDCVTAEGSDRLFVNGLPVCHHGHRVHMNVKA